MSCTHTESTLWDKRELPFSAHDLNPISVMVKRFVKHLASPIKEPLVEGRLIMHWSSSYPITCPILLDDRLQAPWDGLNQNPTGQVIG